MGKTPQQNDFTIAFDGPAMNSNRMVAAHVAAGLRLAFLESYSEDVAAKFRFAVLLSYDDAKALRDLLNRQLKPVENPQ